jgi:hypothetical protein
MEVALSVQRSQKKQGRRAATSRCKLFCARCFRSIWKLFTTSFDIFRAILIRSVFCLHAFVAICLVCFIQNELWYFVNTVGIVFIVFEFFYFALPNGGKEQDLW